MMEREMGTESVRMEEWIEAARQGNRAALNHLFAACVPYLLVAAHHDLDATLRSRLDAADVVQETLIEAYRDLPHFHGRSKGELLAWLRQILQHNVANEHRRHITSAMRSIHCEVLLSEAALKQLRDVARSERDSPSERAQARERTEALGQALRKLPTHYRQVLLLRVWKEHTYAQIGLRLQCSADAARKLWGRAVQELAFLLGLARPLPPKGR